MATGQRPLPTLHESELPGVAPMQFVVAEHEDGSRTLDVRESELERVYNLRDPYSCLMFVAVCHHIGVRVYRRPRQRAVTVCVRTTLSKHEALWSRFLLLTDRLDAKLAEATQQFVRDQIESSDV